MNSKAKGGKHNIDATSRESIEDNNVKHFYYNNYCNGSVYWAK